jgi:protein-L-isoaspartate(D-aspartate) O-methyltransferase
MPDYAAQRFNMVESQVRACDVPDTRIQQAMLEVPRERFVPAAKRSLAYAEAAVEVVPGRFLIEPRTLAKLLYIADAGPSDRALVVGCTTGYAAAVLARLVSRVTALETDADLVRVASEMLPAVGVRNAAVVQGSLADGHRAAAPYDVILLDGGVETVPEAILAQLADGGRLVAVIQQGTQGRAHVYLRAGAHVGDRPGFDAAAPLLPGFRKPVGFVF